MSYGGGIPFPGGQPRYVNPYAANSAPQYGASPAQYGGQMGISAMPPSMPPQAAVDPYANAQPGTIAYAKSEGPDGIETYTPVIAQETLYQTPQGPVRGIKWVTATPSQVSAAGIPPGPVAASNPAQLPRTSEMMSPMTMPSAGFPTPSAYSEPLGDDYPVMRPGMSQRDYEKAVRRWEKDQRAAEKAEKRARKEEKERKRERDRDRERDQWDRDAQDPYDITGGRGGGERQRRMSAGAPLGFERARRMSGGAMLRDEELNRKLGDLDMSFNSRRERRMSGGAAAYAPTAGGFRSRKNSMSDILHDREINDDYGQRPSFYPPAGAGIPGGGGYGAPVPGGYGTSARSRPSSPARPRSAFAATHHDEIPRGGPSPRPGGGGYYPRSRHGSPTMGSSQLPGGYGGPSYGGGRDPGYGGGYY